MKKYPYFQFESTKEISKKIPLSVLEVIGCIDMNRLDDVCESTNGKLIHKNKKTIGDSIIWTSDYFVEDSRGGSLIHNFTVVGRGRSSSVTKIYTYSKQTDIDYTNLFSKVYEGDKGEKRKALE